MGICSITDCDKTAEKRGWCGMHYRRWQRHGSVETVKYVLGNSLADKLARYSHTEGDCLIWHGAGRSNHGYGGVRIEGRDYYVHRLVWEQANGPIPEGLMVCHTCDTPRCCRLEHLFLGTNQDNMDDMKAKGRYPHIGRDRMPQAKFSEQDAETIRKRYAAGGITQTALAAEYGASPTGIWMAIHPEWRQEQRARQHR